MGVVRGVNVGQAWHASTANGKEIISLFCPLLGGEEDALASHAVEERRADVVVLLGDDWPGCTVRLISA